MRAKGCTLMPFCRGFVVSLMVMNKLACHLICYCSWLSSLWYFCNHCLPHCLWLSWLAGEMQLFTLLSCLVYYTDEVRFCLVSFDVVMIDQMYFLSEAHKKCFLKICPKVVSFHICTKVKYHHTRPTPTGERVNCGNPNVTLAQVLW